MKTSDSSGRKRPEVSATFKVGAISLAFLILGYQICLFVNHSAVAAIVAHRDAPDTVFVSESPARDSHQGATGASAVSPTSDRDDSSSHTAPAAESRHSGEHSERAKEIYLSAPSRRIESFRFNPNTVSAEDLVRLGFSEKQSQSIINYREKGGRFRRKSDFARSYVVPDSVYLRLEPFIDIPLVDINKADSAEFDTLPGIGGWFASRMVSYREELGGYSNVEQLMNIWNFDEEKFEALSDLICCGSPSPPFNLWTLPEEELCKHPSIRSWRTAHAIVLYRENNGPEALTVSGLKDAGVLNERQAAELSRCSIAEPGCISRTAP